jgi:hypothetical protein
MRHKQNKIIRRMEDSTMDEAVKKVAHIMELYHRSTNFQDLGSDLTGADLRAFLMCKRLTTEMAHILRVRRSECEHLRGILASKKRETELQDRPEVQNPRPIAHKKNSTKKTKQPFKKANSAIPT